MSESEVSTIATPTSDTPAGTLLPAGSSDLARPTSASPIRELKKIPRVKPPKKGRIYKVVMATIALKAQGLTEQEIADQLGMAKNTIHTYLHRARREGWINLHDFEDPEDRLEYVLKNQVVKNLNSVLTETFSEPADLSQRAVDVSLEVAKGTGLLKQHQMQKIEGGSQVGVALRVQVELPRSEAIPAVRAGSTSGTPIIDAVIKES